ncbi:MAG: hypothetical protein EHM61_16320 [Acidobacteria bacterium]|nr:MAG: hypothetical protein EHM61_16320 [Acidobacteriota bacterium]
MTKRYLIVTKEGDQREAFLITIKALGLKDLSKKLSRRMLRKLLQGDKINRVTVQRIPLDDPAP